MFLFRTKHGLGLTMLALGLLMLDARPAQAALRDGRLGVFVHFPGKGAKVVDFTAGAGAAPRAGVQLGDVILSVNGHHVNNPGQYTHHVGKGGKVLKLHIQRGKKKFHIKVAF